VRAPPTSRKTLGPLTAFESARAAIDLRLRSSDERGQAIDAAGIGNDRLGLWLRLRLVLRLRAMLAFTLAMMFARLLLFALKWLSFARASLTHIGLRLHRDKAGLLPEIREAVTLVVAVINGDRVVGAGLRLVLTELLLGRCDEAEVMLGVLVVILRGYRVAGRPRIARELDVFFGDMRGGTANLDVRSVGLEDTGHRVLAAPVIIIIVIVVAVIIAIPVAHALVVLTVSHVLPLFQP